MVQKDAPIRVLDLFCGAGGSSWGARNAGCSIVAGIDASAVAGEAYASNFPEAKFVHGRLEELDPKRLRRQLGKIDLILASPECTSHSPAKGSAARCDESRDTAFQVARYASVFKPRQMIIENVVSMKRWPRYTEFTEGLQELGFQISQQTLNSADFGVPQSRRRLFLVCDRISTPPIIQAGNLRKRFAEGVLVERDTYKYSDLYSPRRAPATLERAERAIDAVGNQTSFLLVYYGSDAAGGWQRLDRPLRTITTLDRFAHVRPSQGGLEMRMLQVPELKAAMGMPRKMIAGLGTRREQIRAIGNGVCPPVMRAVTRATVATQNC